MLDKLQMYIVFAECLSFTETANKMFCSQPTISHKIKQLEEKYNTVFIQRKNKQIVLTERGKIFLQYAKKMVQLHEQMEKELHQAESSLSVYVSHYIAENYFSKILPNIESFQLQPFSIKGYSYENLKKSLLQEKTKFAIMPVYENDRTFQQGYNVDLLFEEELVLIMACNHHLAERKVIYTRDLESQILLLPENHYLQDLIKEKINQKNPTVQYMEMTNFEIIKQAVMSNLGVAFLPVKVVEQLLGQGKIVAKSIHGCSIKRQNAIVSNAGKQLSQKEQHFCRYVQNQFDTYECPLLQKIPSS